MRKLGTLVLIALLLSLSLCVAALAEGDELASVTPCDGNNTPLGPIAVRGIGEENALQVYFLTMNADEMRVGWDSEALTEAGAQVAIDMEGGFHIKVFSDEPAEFDLRFYLSATDDWSDKDDPPAKAVLRICFTDQPALLLTDANGTAYGETASFPSGETGAELFFSTVNADGMRVGWDEQAMLDAGVQIAIEMEGGFHLCLTGDAGATCKARFYLSAAEDWSDAGDPPAEASITISFTE